MEKIHIKLLEFQTNIEIIKKDGSNSFFKKANGNASSYATLPNILAEVKGILNPLKLIVTQPIINNEVFTIITDTESNESVQSSLPLPNGLNAQQIGSAITYFRRYTLSSLLALEIDEDDDGNNASGQKIAPKPAPIKSDKPWLNEGADFLKAMDYVRGKGQQGIMEIKKKYALSKVIEDKLMTASKVIEDKLMTASKDE